MPEMPQAAPIPDRPPLHLKGGYLAIASPDSIPEAAFSIPAIRALRAVRPMGTFVAVAPPPTAPLFRKMPEIKKVVEVSPADSPRKIGQLLRETGIPFDSAISWEDSSIARAFAKIQIKQRLGFPKEKLAKFLTDPVAVSQKAGPIQHRVQDYLLFTKKLGADPFQPSNFATPERPPGPEKPLIAIAPGSDFGPAAQWPLERFLEVASLFAEENDVIVLPSSDRCSPSKELAKSLNLPLGEPDTESLLEQLGRCTALIANDSSLPHLASFVGTPSVVLFGPNEPEWKRPLGKIHKGIREHVACSGCLLNKCPLDHRCMNEIETKQVIRQAREILGTTS